MLVMPPHYPYPDPSNIDKTFLGQIVKNVVDGVRKIIVDSSDNNDDNTDED